MSYSNRLVRVGAIVGAGALMFGLAACGNADKAEQSISGEQSSTSAPSTSTVTLEGEIKGAGASSQEKAQAAWLDEFMALNSGLTISYDAVGSGGGREKFIQGAVDFAGSDSSLKEEEIAAATERCYGSEPVELPLYISPIAVFYNVPGFEGDKHINMTADVIADVFNGTIKKWNDPRIAELNKDAALPDLGITVVNRSDDSGTTKNFTSYLHKTAPDQWPHKGEETWPIESVQTGDGTSGMVTTVAAAEGTVGYADASRITAELGTVAVGSGDSFTPYSAQAASATLDASELDSSATDTRLVFSIKRDAPNTYPIVLVSYLIGCSTYDDASIADAVKGYFNFIASQEGQELAADSKVAGSAPISDSLRDKVTAVIEKISAQ